LGPVLRLSRPGRQDPGRDSALVTWQNIAERLRIGLRGGTPENEAQLRSQYFTFQAAVDDALAALYSREERLRYCWPTAQWTAVHSSGVRTPDRQTRVPVALLTGTKHLRRVELRRQKWQIKRRELELVAARNYLQTPPGRGRPLSLARFRRPPDRPARSHRVTRARTRT
jgi:hypothetical protein